MKRGIFVLLRKLFGGHLARSRKIASFTAIASEQNLVEDDDDEPGCRRRRQTH